MVPLLYQAYLAPFILRPHFDSCPCQNCSVRRQEHKIKVICECIACVRASFGRCTAKLNEKLKALQNARDARRALRRQRRRARRQNTEYENHMSSSESHQSSDIEFDLLFHESEDDDIREFQ